MTIKNSTDLICSGENEEVKQYYYPCEITTCAQNNFPHFECLFVFDPPVRPHCGCIDLHLRNACDKCVSLENCGKACS